MDGQDGTDLLLLGLLHRLVHELVVDGLVHKEAGARDAALIVCGCTIERILVGQRD